MSVPSIRNKSEMSVSAYKNTSWTYCRINPQIRKQCEFYHLFFPDIYCHSCCLRNLSLFSLPFLHCLNVYIDYLGKPSIPCEYYVCWNWMRVLQCQKRSPFSFSVQRCFLPNVPFFQIFQIQNVPFQMFFEDILLNVCQNQEEESFAWFHFRWMDNSSYNHSDESFEGIEYS